jgi:hypothetical protein
MPEVVDALTENFAVENSKARQRGQFDDQKVVFKVLCKTCGEIEMRNDSEIHYREVKFWLDKKLTFDLLTSQITRKRNLSERITLYGKAINKLLKNEKR